MDSTISDGIVGNSSMRTSSTTREEELGLEGWVRRVTYDEPRLSVLAAAYEELGLEVLVEPYEPGAQQGCAECMLQQPERCRTIYTRRREEP